MGLHGSDPLPGQITKTKIWFQFSKLQEVASTHWAHQIDLLMANLCSSVPSGESLTLVLSYQSIKQDSLGTALGKPAVCMELAEKC